MIHTSPQGIPLQNVAHSPFHVWPVYILGLVSAGAGAFIGSYLKKRGENKALQENFTEIRGQLQITTRDTEEIKQHLSQHLWLSQQVWSARHQHYSELLTHLHRFRISLDELSEYFMEPGSEYLPDDTRGKRFDRLRQEAASSVSEVEKLLGPAALFLSPQALETLKIFIANNWGLITFDAVNTSEYVAGATKLVANATDQILKEAKAQLGIERVG